MTDRILGINTAPVIKTPNMAPHPLDGVGRVIVPVIIGEVGHDEPGDGMLINARGALTLVVGPLIGAPHLHVGAVLVPGTHYKPFPSESSKHETYHSFPLNNSVDLHRMEVKSGKLREHGGQPWETIMIGTV